MSALAETGSPALPKKKERDAWAADVAADFAAGDAAEVAPGVAGNEAVDCGGWIVACCCKDIGDALGATGIGEGIVEGGCLVFVAAIGLGGLTGVFDGAEVGRLLAFFVGGLFFTFFGIVDALTSLFFAGVPPLRASFCVGGVAAGAWVGADAVPE